MSKDKIIRKRNKANFLIPFTIASKEIKCLAINATMEAKDLYGKTLEHGSK